MAAAVGQQSEQGIINICSGRPEKLAEALRADLEEAYPACDIELQYGVFPDRPYDSKAIWGDDTKIEKILNK